MNENLSPGEIFARTIRSAAFRVLAPFYHALNLIRCRKEWVVVLASRFHTRELVEQLQLSGHRVFLFDTSPRNANWRFACRSKFTDVYDRRNVPLIVRTAQMLGCDVVLMPQDDNLIPIYAEANRLLDSDNKFSDIAVQSSLSKGFMRERLAKAGMNVPEWTLIEKFEDIEGLNVPAVLKPLYGQGSNGVTYVETEREARAAAEHIFNELGQSQCVAEEFLSGRQFDVEGVIHNGTPHIFMITEECYTDFLPNFTRPSWYLMGPDLTEHMESEIVRETRAALAACDLYSGAFHLELKFKGNRAITIDLANRMGADFFKYVRLVTGIPAALEYLRAMTTAVEKPRPIKLIPKRPILRYFNYEDHPAHEEIRKIAFAMERDGEATLVLNANQLELAGNEERLRAFLQKVYACRSRFADEVVEKG